MWLRKIVNLLNVIVGPAAKTLNTIAAGVLTSMMILTGVDVTLRYIFNRPIPGSYEITQYIMPIVVAFGLAYCALEDGHVRVELLIAGLPARMQALMNCMANLFFFSLFILITWQSFLRAKGMIDSGLMSEVLYLPVFPFVLTVTVGSATLCLVVLRDFFDSLLKAVSR
jgi:TRAP-type C4-dicarboxylate transport system permease small subunit